MYTGTLSLFLRFHPAGLIAPLVSGRGQSNDSCILRTHPWSLTRAPRRLISFGLITTGLITRSSIQRGSNFGQSRSNYPPLAPAENKPLFILEAVGYASVDHQSAWLVS
ncbi:hypothetical protein BJX66DRAFT_145286 [Aspergillus keveii]|uniref:Uncharacterized protein n=1 Tax=Aspergillus keveii TaxID=714993 RepID=A0ABR4GAQ5_9EURO